VVTQPCKDQFISRLFLVRKKDGFHWPVINLKPLNGFVQKWHFKMEGMVRDFLQLDDWMCSLDLNNTYHSVAIAKDYSVSYGIYEFICLLCSAQNLVVSASNQWPCAYMHTRNCQNTQKPDLELIAFFVNRLVMFTVLVNCIRQFLHFKLLYNNFVGALV